MSGLDTLAPRLFTLPNGLRLIVTPVPHAHSVSISIYVAAGARYEQLEDAGLSHFVEHMVFKGTERRPRPQDIAIEIDALGGSINAATERELTVYYAKVVPEHTGRAVDILIDMLRYSLYRDAEIERERQVILEELAAVEDSPDEQAGILLDGLLWPGQAHGRDIAGSPATVSAISRERLLRYYHEQYVAGAAVISIAGAVDPDTIEALVRDRVEGWPAGEPGTWLRASEEPRGARVGLLAKETEQAHLALGLRALSSTDPDRYPLALLSIILGEGMSSRLFMRLREELGLCYDIHCYPSHLRDAGAFSIYAGVDPQHTVRAIHEIGAELKRARQPVSAEELERAQGLARSRILLRMEDTRAVSGWYGARAILDLPLESPATVIAGYEQATIADLERVAGQLLTTDRLHLAVVGPIESPAPLEAELQIDA